MCIRDRAYLCAVEVKSWGSVVCAEGVCFGFQILVSYVEDCLKGGNLIEEVGLHPNTAGERGLKLLVMLSYVFPSHFLHEDILNHLISFLDYEDDVVPLVLSILTFLGKYRPIGQFNRTTKADSKP